MKKMWKKYSKNKMSVLGFVIIVLLLFLVIFADLYIGYDKVLAQDVKNKLQSPSLSHICGTDNLGRDLFARLIYGARVSLGIGVAATFAGMMIGCILGAACAYIGGIFDNAVMRILDVLYCVPFVLQAMLIVAILSAASGVFIQHKSSPEICCILLFEYFRIKRIVSGTYVRR